MSKKALQVIAATLFIGGCFYFGASHSAQRAAMETVKSAPVASAPASCTEITAEIDAIGDFVAQHIWALLLTSSFCGVCFVNGLLLFVTETGEVLRSIALTLYDRFQEVRHRKA